MCTCAWALLKLGLVKKSGIMFPLHYRLDLRARNQACVKDVGPWAHQPPQVVL